MKRTLATLAIAALTLISVNVASAQGVVAVRPGFQSWGFGGLGYGYTGYGGYSGYGYHSSTAAEGFNRGRAAVIQAAGEYNLNTSQAAINYQQAYRASLENSVTYAETYFAKRRINDSYHDAKQGPPPSQETLAQRARQGVPERLDGNQFEPAFGTLFWPAVFNDSEFSADRRELDRLMADRDAQAGVGSEHFRLVADRTAAMEAELRDKIGELTPTEYVQAKKFLKSLAYEARFVPGAEGLASR
jgi:hypothetical protein